MCLYNKRFLRFLSFYQTKQKPRNSSKIFVVLVDVISLLTLSNSKRKSSSLFLILSSQNNKLKLVVT